MPPRTPRACRKRGCRTTTINTSGYCDEHKGEGWAAYKPGQDRHQRGYGTDWEALRVVVLQRDNHLCQECLKEGLARQAKTVDHIIPKARGGGDDPRNLQSLCWPHHHAKTAKERCK
ncbi:HNH endonuclease [Erwinia rhapontici]|uniref:HNH endonuclease n=1 Tax=Erwinia rhapontici TaxID=55212 RepID=UPI002169E23D|nr:HNH endonuclease signature motif containing protein [Erwinia rhapontici]MCS3605313.1 5-methylcytosine-specific restriction protein A [Erwinia rhapontici]